MDPIQDLSVPLGPVRSQGASLQQIAQRVQMVLDTRPGQLPWRPDFGCDLGTTVGESITDASLAVVRWRIMDAISRWVPEVTIMDLQLDLVRDDGMGIDSADRRIPIAEAALVRFGVQSSIHVRLELETVEGPLVLDASVAE